MVTTAGRRLGCARRLLALVCSLPLLVGCGGFRFVIDAVPQVDDLTETTVLERVAPESGTRDGTVALIDVTGLIVDARPRTLIGRGENPVGSFVEALRRAERDPNVRAVIVRINSPGGTVTASDIMYRELKHFRETTGKPVVTLMGEVAASGGYYLACAGDVVIAHPMTVTGSIGVVMQTINFSEGMSRIGIRADAITSGPNKALASPFQPMPAEHRAILQGLVNEFHDGFVAVVVESRPDLASDGLGRITDGRVVSGMRAREVGLVDEVGDLRTAFAESMERAGLGRARLVKYHRPLEHVGSAYAQTPVAAGTEVNLVQVKIPGAPGQIEGAGFYYLWDPTIVW